ncbi:hypothetical protein [Mesorhizobium sp. GR13]|uniref:hypothetical protein n=1 Tax=Mesorhizobium sp. GR13 TaxID=2562308 RepID=UPI0010C09988|nr:hypothetical protein [Mesorhizobium sp. GR13]
MSAARISLAELRSASASVLAAAETTFHEAQQRKERDIGSAIRERTGLVDGYWKAAHVARLRFEAAKGFYEALNDLSQD